MVDDHNSEERLENDSGNENDSTDIAIVGMACRFPGADNPAQYWDNLQRGYESITELSDEELTAAGVSKEHLKDPNYVKTGMFLQHMELFDAGFFGFSPMDAKLMDPQHRHFLECSWEAFEDAGYDPASVDGSVGVFGGSGHNAYMPYNLLTNPDLVDDVGFFLVRHTGNDKDFLTTRVSYCFDLKGPSINVQTACSTSLVALHSAAQSLLNGECDMALAGGVTIDLPHRRGYLFKDSEILSPDGHCRPFDAGSKGTVFGSGVGVVVLRRLDDALAAGDNIHAVLKASAVNNDGAGKVSYLAPSVDGQAAAIHEALEIGDIDPRSVEYIECHGTGTQLGDPIEVAALSQAYGAGHEGKQYCAIGSVKSNIGHLDTAAGVASLIKVVQALKHRKMPPTLHYRAPNPSIDFNSSPFFVNADLRDWHTTGPRRAGISSLGVGGTNAHIIVEEAPASAQEQSSRDWQLLLLSARSDQALQKGTDRLAEFLDGNDQAQLADVAYTLAVGRRAFNKRRFAVVQSRADAVVVLDGSEKERIESATAPEKPRGLVFMFAGGGTQYAGMGAGLYANESVFKTVVDECLQLLRAFIDYDLKALLYPAADAAEAAGLELQRPSRSLPALFVTQYAQARLWISMGVRPEALIGHSMGENTAACLAGVLSLKDALGLVALRGQLFETVPEGGMLSVQLEEDELQSLLAPGLSIAAQNAPGLSVVSGPKQALGELENTLAAKEISCQKVHIDIAAHSSMLEPILQAFGDYLRSVKLSAPSIPFVSNLTGNWIKDSEANDPDYWVQHLRQTVRFSDGAGRLLEGDKYSLLEVGPGRTLSSLTAMHPNKNAQHTIQSSLRHPDEDIADLPFMLAALGRLWQGNTRVDHRGLYSDQGRRRVSLPTYAFDHARHWVEPGQSLAAAGLTRREQPEQWLYQPTWQRLPQLSPAPRMGEKKVLLLAGQHTLNQLLIDTLQSNGAKVVEVRSGDRLQLGSTPMTVRANNSDDFLHLIDKLQQEEVNISYVVHSLALDLDGHCSLSELEKQRPLVFDSLFQLAQAVGNEGWEHKQKWLVLTAGGQQVAGEPMGSPLQALLAGPARVIPHELTNIDCITVDLALEQALKPDVNLAQRLYAELVTASDTIIALRGAARFTRSYQSMALNSTTDAPLAQAGDAAANDDAISAVSIRDQGVYLITGGTGGLGLVAAETLAQQAAVKLALVARRRLPERQYWQALIDQQAVEAPTLSRILALENSGAQVQVLQGDVTDLESMRAVMAQVEQRWSAVNGVIHTAGIIDDELIQLKEIAQAKLVLAPKVEGTLVLQELFDIATLDFLVLYSSSSAFSGLPGQVDYAAANAFLDSFAHASQDGNVVSINWPAWKDVGMAASIADGSRQRYQPAGRPVDHPLLDRCIQEDEQQSVYSTLFDVSSYWLLNEHRIKEGRALIPGSGFVELARAAFAEARGADAVELRDLAFELPFFVADHEFKALRVSLFYRNAQSADFTITSDSDGEWVEHVRGVISPAAAPSEKLDRLSIVARCKAGEQTFQDADHHPYLDFGHRWEVLKKVSYGRHEACVDLQVDDTYREELHTLPLHPAVLDMATAGAQIIIPDYNAQDELYVPVGYGSLRFGGQFSQQMFSHVVYKPTADSSEHSHDIARFDIRVCDVDGAVLLEVEDFTMQRIADVAALKRAVNNAAAEVNPALQRTLELGIEADEGKAALLTILRQRLMPQAAVSVYDLALLQQELLAPFAEPEAEPEAVLHDADSDAEIADIEQALMNNEALESVVVRSHLDEAGERRLIAHFVPDYDHHITVSELRRYAKQALSQTSVPQQFIELDELPLDEQGVIDRLQLKDPFAPEDTYIAPRTSTERALAKIWQDTLGIDRVGLNENFFDIGGHSLLSIRIIVRVDKKFGVRLDQATMVLHTLEQIASEIDEQRGAVEEPEAAKTQQPVAATSDASKESKGLMNKLFGRK